MGFHLVSQLAVLCTRLCDATVKSLSSSWRRIEDKFSRDQDCKGARDKSGYQLFFTGTQSRCFSSSNNISYKKCPTSLEIRSQFASELWQPEWPSMARERERERERGDDYASGKKAERERCLSPTKRTFESENG